MPTRVWPEGSPGPEASKDEIEGAGPGPEASSSKVAGRRGGYARAAALTPEARQDIARAAAQARWSRQPLRNGPRRLSRARKREVEVLRRRIAFLRTGEGREPDHLVMSPDAWLRLSGTLRVPPEPAVFDNIPVRFADGVEQPEIRSRPAKPGSGGARRPGSGPEA